MRSWNGNHSSNRKVLKMDQLTICGVSETSAIAGSSCSIFRSFFFEWV
jgi:hypothetical protein